MVCFLLRRWVTLYFYVNVGINVGSNFPRQRQKINAATAGAKQFLPDWQIGQRFDSRHGTIYVVETLVSNSETDKFSTATPIFRFLYLPFSFYLVRFHHAMTPFENNFAALKCHRYRVVKQWIQWFCIS